MSVLFQTFFYLKNYYKDEALFAETKIVTSVYSKGYEGKLDETLLDKITQDGIAKESIEKIKSPCYNNLLKVCIDHSDGVILASQDVPEEIVKYTSESNKPFLPYVEKEHFAEAYLNFYREEFLK